jgi:hypothetical protein
MAHTLPMQQSDGLVSIQGMKLSQVFTETALDNGRIRVPPTYFVLPDFRPKSDRASLEAREGWAPEGTDLANFDALLGPFSLEGTEMVSWAQSLEFMRDIKGVSVGATQLSHSWIKTWLQWQRNEAAKPQVWFTARNPTGTKTDRLVVRSRRILNCLSHVLPLVPSFDQKDQATFWTQLFQDVVELASATIVSWRNLKEVFHPFSARALWSRSVAILGVEAAFPGYLRSELVAESCDAIKAAIQSDGLVNGGSIVGTLAAGADLLMLGSIAEIHATLAKIQCALVELRHSDGTLVTFGRGSAQHRKLLLAVVDSDERKPAGLLQGSGIGRITHQKTTVWLRAAQSASTWGAACEIEVNGASLVTCSANYPSAVALNGPVFASGARCKRRDEPDCTMLETHATLKLLGQCYSSVRQVRINFSGAQITGEDLIRPEKKIRRKGITEIYFGIPSTYRCNISKDRLSVLIVTSQQQAWRFRVSGMDFLIEIRSAHETQQGHSNAQHLIVCKSKEDQNCGEFRAFWQFALEEIE